jgi:hypothetical protein
LFAMLLFLKNFREQVTQLKKTVLPVPSSESYQNH